MCPHAVVVADREFKEIEAFTRQQLRPGPGEGEAALRNAFVKPERCVQYAIRKADLDVQLLPRA